MKKAWKTPSTWSHLITACRLVVATMVVCCFFYCAFILAFAQLATPKSAEGSLIRNEYGAVIGSELIAQGFSRSEYFWPRPSAVEYNASGSGGSNLSPAGQELRRRAQDVMRKMDVADGKPIPTDLLTASGSGLDPHISLTAAKFQAERVARARGLALAEVMLIIENYAEKKAGGFDSDPLVNVLALNLVLDKTYK
jgi:K+-transporting ATPase ATPase C chain